MASRFRRLVAACLIAATPAALPDYAFSSEPPAQPLTTNSATTKPREDKHGLGVGEKVPSEDPVIWDLHSLGLLNGSCNIFRSASPLRDLVKKGDAQPTDAATIAAAKARMKHLHDIGIRTIISFEKPYTKVHDADAKDDKDVPQWIELERTAATEMGIRWVSYPMANSGPNSLETMPDDAVVHLLDGAVAEIFRDAHDGGVMFHCAAGHDRTGIVSAYLRIKYEHWPVEQAIAEMRRYGHNWPKFSRDGGLTSWHEAHLRAIAEQLDKADHASP